MRGCNSTGTSIISTVLFCLALTAAEFALADEPCGSAHGITTYCGFEGPEDIAQIPDSPFLIISQYAAHGQFKPGSLVSFNIETEE